MKLRTPHLALLFLSFLPLSVRAESVENWRLILPDAALMLYSPNLPEARAAWEAGSLNQLYQEARVQQFLAPLLEGQEDQPWQAFLAEWEKYRLDEMLALYDGAFAFSVEIEGNFDEEEMPMPPMLFAGPVSDETTFASIMDRHLALLQADEDENETEEMTEEYLGVTLRVRRQRDEAGEWQPYDAWAIADGISLYGYPAESVRTMVARLQNPPDAPDWAADWPIHVGRIGMGNFFCFLNLRPFEAMVREGFITGFERGTGGKQEVADAGKMYEAIGFDALQSVALSVELGPKRSQVGLSGIVTVMTGVWKLVAYTDAPLPQPTFASAEPLRSGVMSFSFGQLYDVFFETLRQASPQLAQVLETQLAGVQGQLGVDLRKELFGGLGDGIYYSETFRRQAGPVAAADLSSLETDQVFAFTLQDQTGVETAINTLRNALGGGLPPFDTREFLGVMIHSSKVQLPVAGEEAEGGSGMVFSYAITDGWLFFGVGSEGALERVLTEKRDPGPTIWELPEVREAFAVGQPPPQALEYANMERLTRVLLPALRVHAEQWEGLGDYLDLTAFPEPEVVLRHVGSVTTRTYWGENGFSMLMDLRGVE